jgi:hypothetical protein
MVDEKLAVELLVGMLTAINALLVLAGVGIFYLSLKLYTEYKKDRMMDLRAEGGKKPGIEGLLQLMASQAGRRPRTAPAGSPMAERPDLAGEPGCKAEPAPGGGENKPGGN